jgi:hypothetical protein
MKKKIFLFILINFLGFQLVYSQNTMTNTTKDALNNLYGSQKISANSVLYGIPTPPSEIVGDFFYDSTFVPAKVVLVGDKTVYETFARLDLKNKILEIREVGGNRWIENNKISFFTLNTKNTLEPTLFFNVKNFLNEEEDKTGFFEVLQDGKGLVLQHTKISVRKPTYNQALGTGDLNAKVMRENDFFYAIDGKTKKISNSKKSMLAIFGDKKADIAKFISQNEVDLKSRVGLTKLFNYYESLK